MSPHIASVIPSLSLLALTASCASSTGGDPDASFADSRPRFDAAVVDAMPGSPDADTDLVDAMPGSPDAANPPADASTITGGLLISEIVDANLAGGLPAFVELTNYGASAVDLAGYTLAIFNNGSATVSSSVTLAGNLPVGNSFVVSYETGDTPGSSTFRSVYGFDADDLSQNKNINGDDTVVLYQGGTNGTIIDIFGQIGVDGNGTIWEYTDSYAYRVANGGAANTWTASDWVVGGVNALDTADAAAIAAVTTPGQ